MMKKCCEGKTKDKMFDPHSYLKNDSMKQRGIRTVCSRGIALNN